MFAVIVCESISIHTLHKLYVMYRWIALDGAQKEISVINGVMKVSMFMLYCT